MNRAWAALWVVAGLQIAGCFSGVKRVRDGEPCVSGDQVLKGEVACDQGFTCVPLLLSVDGDHQGVCFPACATDAVCAAGHVCATGACVPPCSSGCSTTSDSFGPCCGLPDGVNACLPQAACGAAGGQLITPTDAQPDLDADGGS